MRKKKKRYVVILGSYVQGKRDTLTKARKLAKNAEEKYSNRYGRKRRAHIYKLEE